MEREHSISERANKHSTDIGKTTTLLVMTMNISEFDEANYDDFRKYSLVSLLIMI
jgi:hypothetical protein